MSRGFYEGLDDEMLAAGCFQWADDLSPDGFDTSFIEKMAERVETDDLTDGQRRALINICDGYGIPEKCFYD